MAKRMRMRSNVRRGRNEENKVSAVKFWEPMHGADYADPLRLLSWKPWQSERGSGIRRLKDVIYVLTAKDVVRVSKRVIDISKPSVRRKDPMAEGRYGNGMQACPLGFQTSCI